MSEKIQGTIVLDGLIEGRLPDDAAVRDNLEQWVAFVGKEIGIRFSLDMSGNGFSLLPDDHAVPCQTLGTDPDQAIVQALEQLVDLLPDDLKSQVFSTLRSSEYRKGEEVQSMYAVNPDGSIASEKRTVDADTTAPPQPLSLKEKVKMGGIGLGLAVIVFGVMYLLGLLDPILSQVSDTIKPEDVTTLEISFADLSPYVTLDQPTTANKPSRIVIPVVRTKAYPDSAEKLTAAMQAAGDNVKKRLAIEAIAKGYITVEVFIGKGEKIIFARAYQARIRDLEREPSVTVDVPVIPKARIKRIVLTY